MSLIPCPECKKKISESVENCPNCGYTLTPEKIKDIKENQINPKRGVGIGFLIIVVLLIVICSIPTTKSPSKPIVLPKYQIVEIEDVSFSKIKRYSVRIRVENILKSKEIESISQQIIEELKVSKSCNAITLFFYLPDSDTNGLYTAGKAVWAPYGDWSRANEVKTGDYKKHKLLLFPGNAVGLDSEKIKVKGIAKEKKKKIFFDLVATQDSGVDDNEAFIVIAKKYGIEVDIIKKIAMEGIVQGWPMP